MRVFADRFLKDSADDIGKFIEAMSQVMRAGATGHWAGSLRELQAASAEVGGQLLRPHRSSGRLALRRVLWALTGLRAQLAHQKLCLS